MDIKTIFTHFKIDPDSVDLEGHTFSGLAATYDQDLGGDVILPGAFKRTLANWRKAKRKVPFVDSHNVWGTVTSVVGQMDKGEETDEGLQADFSMIADDERSDAVFKRIELGVADGLSIGYQAVQVKYPDTEEERQQGIYRYLKEVKLREISVVLFPMNPQARIDLTTAKMLLVHAGERDLETDEVKELIALHAQITDVLKGEGAEGFAPPEKVLADPAKTIDLVSRIDGLMHTGLATRIDAAQHSGSAVLTDL